jgi:hypothetical protein
VIRRPLLRVVGSASATARDDLHGLAVGNRAFVVAMEASSTPGAWWVYLLGFTAVTGWLPGRWLTGSRWSWPSPWR